MNKVGHICPFGGTHPSQGWDTCGTPGPFSFIFLSIISLGDKRGADG